MWPGTIFEAFLKSRYNTIMNNYVNGVSNRLLTSISIIIFSYGLISFNDLIFLQPLIYFIGLLILIFYGAAAVLFRADQDQRDCLFEAHVALQYGPSDAWW